MDICEKKMVSIKFYIVGRFAPPPLSKLGMGFIYFIISTASYDFFDNTDFVTLFSTTKLTYNQRIKS